MKKIIDVITGEEIVLELTDEEKAELAAEGERIAQLKAAQELEALKISEAKSALLEKLGITEDEAKLLLS
jgi:hypothetical protein